MTKLGGIFLLLLLGLSEANAQESVPAMPPPTTASELTLRPGTAPVTLSSVGPRLHLGTYEGSTPIDVQLAYRSNPTSIVMLRPLCDTPCTLYLPPGKHRVRVTGDGILSHTDSFEVPSGGVDLTLRAPKMRSFSIGLLSVILGGLVVVPGAILVGVGHGGESYSRGMETFTHRNEGMIIGGGVMLGIGAALLTTGIVLIATNRGGVLSSRPHDPSASTAKLSLGAGNLRVVGTF